MHIYVMNNEKTISRKLQSTETGTWTKKGQLRTYKKQNKPDNTIVLNKAQIVKWYKLKYS